MKHVSAFSWEKWGWVESIAGGSRYVGSRLETLSSNGSCRAKRL